MSELTLSATVKCVRCSEPLVEEWMAYWVEPAHGNCRIYAEAVKTNPARFGLEAPVPPAQEEETPIDA